MNSFKSLMNTIIRLRDPDNGCPWDIKQNIKTLAPAIFDECCELLDGVANSDYKNIEEELGDIFFTTSLISYVLEQEKKTTVENIINNVNNKMISRHPHVFNQGESLSTSDEVLIQWEKIKIEKEGRVKKHILDKIPESLPSLEKSLEIQKKVSKVGFDWDNIDDVFDKILEEIEEVKHEINHENTTNLEEEIGDLLFSVINLSRKLNINPSLALGRTNKKFTKRFNYVEKEMEKRNIPMSKEEFKLMDNLWEKSKSQDS